jgi:hypothetical protein
LVEVVVLLVGLLVLLCLHCRLLHHLLLLAII